MEIFWTVLTCSVIFGVFYFLKKRDYEKQIDDLAKSANQQIKYLKLKLDAKEDEIIIRKSINNMGKITIENLTKKLKNYEQKDEKNSD